MPIDVFRYGKWMLAVPVIHVFLFTFLLDFPFDETHWTNAATVVYIYIALLALTIRSLFFQWSLVALCLSIYAYTTVLQVQMVQQFQTRFPSSRPGFKVRVGITILIMVLYAIYGVIYLARCMADVYDGDAYMYFDVIAKFVMSICLADVWNSEHTSATIALTVSHARWGMSFLSILRSSYDYVLPCEIEYPMACRILNSQDASALGQVISQDVAGESFHDLLLDSEEVRRFKEYMRQVLATQASGPTSFPPLIAQACHVDLKGRDAGSKLPAVVFLSAATAANFFGSFASQESRRRVIAVRLSDGEIDVPVDTSDNNVFTPSRLRPDQTPFLKSVSEDSSTDMPLPRERPFGSSSSAQKLGAFDSLDSWTEGQVGWISSEIFKRL